jgi:quinoprotein glucose dehydrogenase
MTRGGEAALLGTLTFGRSTACAMILAIGGITAACAGSAPPRAPAEWPIYGGGNANIRYSPLTQITRENVARLQQAWTFDSGDAFPGSELQCNPIIVNGTLYATTPKVNVVALDAATGQQKWRFDPHQGRRVLGKMRNRGVTFWSDGGGVDAVNSASSGADSKPADERIFVAVRQYLYALNAKTGQPIPTFGVNGRVDLRDGLREGERDMVSFSTPGIVFKDLLIVGSTTSENLPTPPGDVRAFDVRTGKIRWTFHTIPRPGEFGHDTWPKDAWRYAGSANNWTGMALDHKRGLVFVPTGSAAYDFYGGNRAGDNLFANALIALKAATGERVWHFQTVRHDIWDRDLPAPPNLVTVTRDGRTIDAVAQTTKSGFVYLFERETGKPLFPIDDRKYPASDLEGEVTAPLQPLPIAPKPFARQRLTAEMLTTRTPAAHAAALARFKMLRSDGQFIPGSRQGTIIFPGYDGGAEWGGAAFDPETSLLYVNSNEMAWILTMVKPPAPDKTAKAAKKVDVKALYQKECGTCHGADFKGAPPEFPPLTNIDDKYNRAEALALLSEGSGRMPSFARLGNDGLRAILDYIKSGGKTQTEVAATGPSPMDMPYLSDGYVKFLDAEGYPAVSPPWGTLNAINLSTGDYAWTIPFGEYPELAAKGMKNTGTENYGGPVVTAGGVLFIGATNFDRKFRAFDKKTGELLWETTLPFAGNATPSVYEVNGRQFVVIAAGGGKSKEPPGARYIAFALPVDATR